MPEWNELDVAYEQDSYWTPRDPIALRRRTEEAQAIWEVGHRKDTGQHDSLLVPQAGALIAWSGAAYSILTHSNFSSVSRLAAGSVRLTLGISMAFNANAGSVGKYAYTALVWTGPHDEPVFSIEDATGTKDATKVDVLIKDNTNTAIDKSFLVLIFGVRA